MVTTNNKTDHRIRRHARIRARVTGTAARPRLAVFKTNRYLVAQLIDDQARTTMVGMTSKTLTTTKMTKTDAARSLGTTIAEAAKKKNISRVVFDRGGFRYAGRVRACAEGAREAGLIF